MTHTAPNLNMYILYTVLEACFLLCHLFQGLKHVLLCKVIGANVRQCLWMQNKVILRLKLNFLKNLNPCILT